MKELIFTHFDIVLGGSSAIIGAFIGALVGGVATWFTTKNAHKWSVERERETRLFDARKEVYAECISMLYMHNAKKDCPKEEKENVIRLLQKAEILSGLELESILRKIFKSYAWESKPTEIPDVSLEIAKAKLEMKKELGQEINQNELDECNEFLEGEKSGMAAV